MTTKRLSATTREARQSALAVTRVTGEWYCQSGSHYTKGEQLTRNGRRICAKCKARLAAITKKRD